MLARIEQAITVSAPVWYWLRVRCGKEQDAADWLREAEIPAYWPNYPALIKRRKFMHGRLARRELMRPIIPGAIFTSQVPGAPCPYDVIERTPGVIGIMRNPDGLPLHLAHADIEIIRRIEAQENTPPPARVHTFRLDQKVRLSADIHAHFPPGKVSRLYKDGRISVDIPVLGRIVPFVVFPHQIEAM